MVNMRIVAETNTETTLECECPFCGKSHKTMVPRDELERGLELRRQGKLIQVCFPTWTPSQREFIMTGICDECWSSL